MTVEFLRYVIAMSFLLGGAFTAGAILVIAVLIETVVIGKQIKKRIEQEHLWKAYRNAMNAHGHSMKNK